MKHNIQTTQKKNTAIETLVTTNTTVVLTDEEVKNILLEYFNLPEGKLQYNTENKLGLVWECFGIITSSVTCKVPQDVPSAQEYVDPNDPRTWKVGDLIECLDSYIAPVGNIEKIAEIDFAEGVIHRTNHHGSWSRSESPHFSFDSVNDIWKWHSRPTK